MMGTCLVCGGTGSFIQTGHGWSNESLCGDCHGTGRVPAVPAEFIGEPAPANFVANGGMPPDRDKAWTATAPTAPGFYWAKATRAHPPIVVKVVWAAWLDRVLVVQVAPDRYEDPSRYVAWAGPLVPPGGE
jgi:hypothetical protein